jgi:spermidine synthase
MARDVVIPPRVAAHELPPGARESGRSRGLLPTLLLLFFFTGACGLVYQQLWVRLLSLVFGVTVYAVSTVLASFFAGLALGSYAAARLVDRAHRPLRWYGVVEVLVGVAALGTTAALSGVERVYIGATGTLPDSVGLLTVVRFGLSFAVLLVPATLMGASLPIVVRSALTRSRRLGERVSLLYATNTAGAIAGTLLAGFWLIGERGLTFSFRLAAAVNIAVGVIALIGSRLWEARHAPAVNAPPPETMEGDAPETVLPERTRVVVLVVFTISGFVSLALEVVWFRVLLLYLESTTYAFTIMLATVLAGIALGSYAVAPLMRFRIDWVKVLVATEIVASVVALASLWLLSQSYSLVDPARDTGLADSDIQPMLVTSALAILPTTLLFGFAFPIGVRLWTAAPPGVTDGSGRRVGVFYAFNVAAGIVGSVVAGFVLVPQFGTRRSLVALAALLLVSGLLVVFVSARPRVSLTLAAASVGVFALTTATAVPNPYAAALEHRYPGERLLWQEEGIQTTVSIHATAAEQQHTIMYLDGLHQASTVPGVLAGHRGIGTLPMAVHPDPDSALVIGLGGGVTAGGLAAFGHREVDVVELSDEVVQGARRFFSDVNGDVLDQPNVDVRIDDGRNYLLTTDEKYDVITADIILPHHAGAGNLWSVDYWRLARDALEDGGIMAQWIPARSDTEYKLIMRSFLEVFPNATLWAGGSMMIGSKQPVTLDPAVFERKLTNPKARAALPEVGVTGFGDLVALYASDADKMRAFVGEGPLLTDDRPRLEYERSLDTTRRRPDLSRLVTGADRREILER